MKYSEQIKPISYLKANTAEILRRMAERREPMIITQNGVAKAVIQKRRFVRANTGNDGAIENSRLGQPPDRAGKGRASQCRYQTAKSN